MKFHRLLGVSILPALLVMPAMATDYNMTDGTKIVLTADETITNTIETQEKDGESRKTGILVSGNTSIDTGEHKLIVNSSGENNRNYVFDSLVADTDFNFTGNLNGTASGTGSTVVNGIRQTKNLKSVFDGDIKVAVSSENADALGVGIWGGGQMTFDGEKTDISTMVTGTGEYAYAVQNFSSDGAVVNLLAKETNLEAQGNSSTQGIMIYRGTVNVGSDEKESVVKISAKNDADNDVNSHNVRGIGVQGDYYSDGTPLATSFFSLNGDKMDIEAHGGWATGILNSGANIGTSGVKDLNVTAESDDFYTQAGVAYNVAEGLVNQYGAKTVFAEDTDNVFTAKAMQAGGSANGVANQYAYGASPVLESLGNLTAIAESAGSANGFYNLTAQANIAQLTAEATAVDQAVGAFIIDSNDVVLGSVGKISSLKGMSSGGEGVGLVVYKTAENKEAAAVLKGTMIIEGSSVGIENIGVITNDADLTVKNGLANSGSFINNNKMVVESDIHNDGTFTNNSVLNVDGIIYNATNGVLTIASGTTSIDGGITGDGSLTINEGATLNIGTASIEQGSMTLAENATLNATLLNVNNYASFNVENLTADENSEFNLTLKGVGSYNVFKNAVTSVNVDYDNNLFDIAWNANKDTITVSTKSTEEIASNTHIAHESAAAVSHIASAASVSESKQLQELSLKLQERLANGDTASVEHATKAVHPETESVAQSVSSSVQNTVVNAAAARMAMPAIGRSAGDVNLTSGAVWAQGIFNKTKQNDAFHGYTRGIAAGLDGTINKVWTIGAAYSFAHSDVTGSARDTEIDSNTLFIYGQYKPSEWYLNAIANYTWSDYSENGSVIDGALVSADYDVQSFGGHIATGYNFHNGITPELGLRYMHVNADDYTNSYGIKTSMKDTDFLTGMAGAKYAFDITSGKHAKFTPELKAGVKYDLLSDKSVATIAMPGVNAYSLDGNRLNRLGGEFGIGFGMTYDNLQLSINYDIDVRKDYTSQTGMLKFRYSF